MTKAINATQRESARRSALLPAGLRLLPAGHIRFPPSSRHRIIGAPLLGSVKTKAAQMSKGISVCVSLSSLVGLLMASLTVERSFK